jgi:predicted DNA-binding transcriptional regulator AlpA
MIRYSTRQAAKKLGITQATLSTYIKAGKVPAPETVQIGQLKVHSWSETQVRRLRRLLPKIANGRKTRYQKQKGKKEPQPRAAGPYKKKK